MLRSSDAWWLTLFMTEPLVRFFAARVPRSHRQLMRRGHRLHSKPLA
jgi:hypothetical protein